MAYTSPFLMQKLLLGTFLSDAVQWRRAVDHDLTRAQIRNA
jgi:hypothetical protein